MADDGTQRTELHRPVMLGEVLAALDVVRGGTFVDATLGLGGHTEGILQASPVNRVIGLDRDRDAIKLAEARLAGYEDRFQAIHSDYRQLGVVLDRLSSPSINGILADLGVSSWQLDSPERGFSFRFGTEPLDMRMDQSQGPTAAELLQELSESDLADLIFEFGEERAARRIARRVVASRASEPIKTTGQLADLVIKAINQKGRWRIHPATRTFQALRIAVNRELEGIDDFVNEAIERLSVGGRLAIITFHSLEDRIIKQAFRKLAGQCTCPPTHPFCICGAKARVELLTRKAVVVGEQEVESNPRARSAKLRCCIKI